MIKKTPFHERLSELSQTDLWSHWSGFLSATRYDFSTKYEYFGVRNAAGLFDSSPMFKYSITGADAEKFLAGVMARDIRTLAPGRAQYQVWVNDAGHVLEDGVVFRHSNTEFLLTAAEPNLDYFLAMAGRLNVSITDVSDEYGFLAVQGPHSRAILAELAPEVTELRYFGLTPAKIAGHPVSISRTGYSGDLGYELLIPAESALPVLDAILEAGRGHQLRPFGTDALGTVRIEAGLPLIGVDFSSARFAFNGDQRFTPNELGLGWMLKGIEDSSRPFIGRKALRAEIAEKSSRWATIGLMIDPKAYDQLYVSAGLIPHYDEVPAGWDTMLYDNDDNKIGYAPSLCYSPVLQQYIALARVKPEAAVLGSTIHVEQTVNHEYVSVAATVTKFPFYNPERKTAMA